MDKMTERHEGSLPITSEMKEYIFLSGRMTGHHPDDRLLICEEERLLDTKGVITKDKMYKIMRHLAEKLAEYEDLGTVKELRDKVNLI